MTSPNPGHVSVKEANDVHLQHWLERRGPVAEKFKGHLARLPAAARLAGPIVRGEIVRVIFRHDLFDDVPWDLAGPGEYGVQAAQAYLQQQRQRRIP